MKTVVIVDDEQDLCELYQMLFKGIEANLLTFTNPLEAVEYLNQNQVDHCLIDYRMPELTGIELRQRIPDTIPCYLVTGELDMSLPPGFVRLIDKPFGREELLKILES
jgi:CheY-like chemotaxis protein